MISREDSINTNKKVDNNKLLIGCKFGGCLLLGDYVILLKLSFESVECNVFGNDQKIEKPEL